MHHSGCDVVPVQPSQVLRQRQHGGQFLLTELPIVPSAKSISDKVRGSVGVKSKGGAGPASHQEFMHPTQIQPSLRRSNGSLGNQTDNKNNLLCQTIKEQWKTGWKGRMIVDSLKGAQIWK